MADEAHCGQYGLSEKVDAETGKIKIGTARIISQQPAECYIHRIYRYADFHEGQEHPGRSSVTISTSTI